jgi:DNA polymerase/3'-5' exonuclease PolX
MELNLAIEIANRVHSLAQPACSRVEIAGSIRRQKSSVKDIELVAIVDNYPSLFQSLTSVGKFIKPGVPDIIPWEPKENAKYLRMLLDGDIKLDLFCATPDNWGGLYMMRTGSGAGPDGNPYEGFVPGMFGRWKKISGGGKMTGGHPTLPDGTLLSVKEEQDYFDLVKVKWIPPELRSKKSIIKEHLVNS